jgi:hypothetical protein
VTVKEVIAILMDCEQDRNIYVQDSDGTAQIVTAIGDLRHVGLEDMPGITIPDDIYFMAQKQFEETVSDDTDI